MRRVEWTDDASAELDAFADYLEAISPDVARRASADIIAAARRFSRYSHIGRPGRRDGTREFSVTRWRKVIVYRILEDRV